MKTRSITKNELIKRIRDSKQDRFEIIEPVTQETVQLHQTRLKAIVRETGVCSTLLLPLS